jgi:hypothetical protein
MEVLEFKTQKEVELARWKAEQEIDIKRQAQKDAAMTARAQAARQPVQPAAKPN